jgi:hypothetical protein
LKDLDKKWFAFSIMDIGVGEMLRKLEEWDKFRQYQRLDTVILHSLSVLKF